MILAGVPLPSAPPSVEPSIAAAPGVNPFWAGFSAGCWVMAGIFVLALVAFLVGRYWEPPARKKK